ncbi:hypothetical protein [Endozoicomonas ascidiicola]|uniref:hypothetical protein n=1 Tax=Endozoicomonas ascidiicola TaxID=1698521 RepID=UPI00082E8229|nr:hypothetical protein [Endozoicomonas ascidiicola]
MKNRTIVSVFMLALVGVCALSSASACETKDGKPKQSQRFEQLNNNKVHTWRSVIVVDQPLKLHRHDYPRVVTALRDGTLKRTLVSGEVLSVHHWQAGESYWLDADPENELHYCVNAGNEPLEVVVTEIK